MLIGLQQSLMHGEDTANVANVGHIVNCQAVCLLPTWHVGYHSSAAEQHWQDAL